MSNIQWALDPTHSEIQFKIKHLMISTVTGSFKKFDLNVTTATDDFSSASAIDFTADLDSIFTNNAQRDEHLKSADFFNIAEHKQIVYKGNKYEKNGGDAKLQGDLTISGTTKSVPLNVEFGGTVVDPYGQIKAGFTVTGKFSRKDFGITFNGVTEAGNLILGDEVKLEAEIQLVKKS
ncbi:MAG: YceI family protein [Flavitalea sp.]